MSGALSPILGIPQVAPNQNNKEVTINNAVADLEAAANAVLVLSFASSTAVQLTAAQFAAAQMFRCQSATAASTLTVPTTMRDFAVRNEGNYAITVGGATGATVQVPAGDVVQMQNDGTDTVLVTSSAGATPGIEVEGPSGIIGSGNATVLSFSANFTLASPSNGVVAVDIATALTQALRFTGTWNASTNNPALTSGQGTAGALYRVTTAGTTTLDGISQWNVGDAAVFNGVTSTWEKFDGIASEVFSVAGRTGAVTLAVADVSGAAPLASPTFTSPSLAADPSANDKSELIPSTQWVQNFLTAQGYVTAGSSPVTSVFGNTGAVTVAEAVTAGLAPSASPTFTGPVASSGTFSTTNGTLGFEVIPGGAIAGATAPFFANMPSGYSRVLLQLMINSQNVFYVDSAGDVITTGNLTGGSIEATGTFSISTQGFYLQWNKIAGTGAGYIINQKGTGTGGLYFGESSASNVFTQNAYLDASGNFTARGSLAGAGINITGGIPWSQLPAEAQQLPIPFVVAGQPTAGATFYLPLVAGYTLPASMTGSQGYSATKATSTATCTVSYIRSGTTTQIGTVAFSSSSSTPTFTASSGYTSQAGDILVFAFPSTQDATLAGVGVTLLFAKV